MAFGRIFHPINFKDLVTEDQAEAIAKKADALIEGNAHLVFGIFTKDGGAINFTSEKKQGDTHVALLMGPEAMAALSPIGADLKRERYSDNETVKSQHQLIKELQAEVRQLRGKSNG
jgi:hypothetical protein